MCGRAAQTHHAVRAAAESLLGTGAAPSGDDAHTSHNGDSGNAAASDRPASHPQDDDDWQDNYNMAPGMSATIFVCDDDGTIKTVRKVWGLVSKGGSTKSPLDTGMSQHFANLMFNARSDTLLEKRTFAPLFHQKRTCIVALDGFFEWKPGALKGDKKQPYYVQAQTQDYLLLPGLWTSVSTGREDPHSTLDTFTIITTEACPALQWLHSRMPMCVYDVDLARRWLQHPTSQLFRQLDSTPTPPDYFQSHAVTKQMSNMKYRSPTAIQPLPPPSSVKAYFSAARASPSKTLPTRSKPANYSDKSKNNVQQSEKAPLKRGPSSPSPKKKRSKKGPIESFFSPKPK